MSIEIIAAVVLTLFGLGFTVNNWELTSLNVWFFIAAAILVAVSGRSVIGVVPLIAFCASATVFGLAVTRGWRWKRGGKAPTIEEWRQLEKDFDAVNHPNLEADWFRNGGKTAPIFEWRLHETNYTLVRSKVVLNKFEDTAARAGRLLRRMDIAAQHTGLLHSSDVHNWLCAVESLITSEPGPTTMTTATTGEMTTYSGTVRPLVEASKAMCQKCITRLSV